MNPSVLKGIFKAANEFTSRVLELMHDTPDAPDAPKRKKKYLGFKRPRTAYMLFVQDHRPAIVSEHPDWSFSQIGKQVATDWGKLSESKRQPFYAMAAKDKKRYLSDIAKYDAALESFDGTEQQYQEHLRKRDQNQKQRVVKKKAAAAAGADDADDDDDDDDDDNDDAVSGNSSDSDRPAPEPAKKKKNKKKKKKKKKHKSH